MKILSNRAYSCWGLGLALAAIVLAVALSPVYAPPAQAQGASTVSFQKDFVDALENDGTKEITLTVTPALTTASTVQLRSLPGDARHNAPDDAYDLPESVAIPAGQSAVTFDVTLTDDNLVQGEGQYDRVLAIGLVAPANAPYQLGKKKTRLNIGDDDVATVSFEKAEYEVAEGGSVAATIKLDHPLTFDVIVYLRTRTDADPGTPNATPEDDYNAWDDYFVRLYNGATKPTLQPKMSTYADDDDDAGEVFQLEIYRVQALVNDRDAATHTVEIGADPATIKITAPQSPGDNEASQVQNLEVLQGKNELYMRWEPAPLTVTSYELHYTSAAASAVADNAAKTSGTDASQGWVNANLDTDLSERINGTLRGLASETAYRLRIRAIQDGRRTGSNNQPEQYRIASGKWVFHGPVSTKHPPLHPLNVRMRPGNARAYLEFNRPPWEVSGYHIGVRLEGEELREEIVSYRPTKPYGGEGTIKYVLGDLTNGTTYLLSVRSCRIREINPYAPTGCGRWTEEQAITPEGAISTFPTDQTGPVRLHRGPGALLVEWDHFGSTGTYRIHYTSDPRARVNDSIHTSETDPAFGWVDTGFVHQDFGDARPNYLIKGLAGGKEHKVRIESRGTFGTGWRLVQAIPVQRSKVWIVDEHAEVSIDEHFGGFRDIRQARVAIYPFLEKEIAIRFRAEDGTARERVDFTILPHFTYIPAFAKSAPLTIKSTGPDRVTDGGKTATIRVISEREFYQADPDRETVALTVVDNSKTQQTDDEMSNFWLGREYVTVEEGDALKYQVGFRGNPTANVTISARVAYDDSNGRLEHDISRSPATLTWQKSGGFGGSDEFTLQVKDDNVAQGDVVYYILHHLDSSDANFDSDRQFHSLAEDQAAILKVTVTDNDSGQGAPVNRAPTVASPIADVDDLPAGDTRQISLSGVFRYEGFGELTIFAASSDDTVAQVSTNLDGSSLTLSGESAGTAAIRVIAEDPQGERVFDEFDVTVTASEQQQQANHAPTLASAIDDVDSLPVGDTRQISLSGVFDYDGQGALTIATSSSDNDVARATAAADGSGLTVSGESAGTATIRVVAEDPDGDRASDEFAVTVTGSDQQQQPAEPPEGPEPWNIRVVPGDGALTVTWNVSSRDGVEDSEIWHVLRWSQEAGVWANPRDPRAVGKNDGLSVDPGLTGYTITGLENGVATGVFVRSMVGHRNNMSERDGKSSKWVRTKGKHTTPVAPPNAAPTVAAAIADATIVNESGTHDVSLSGVFSDVDEDDLTITAASSAESVATVAVSADYSTLTVTAKARGTATVTVTAADGRGGSVEDSFTVEVKAAPTVTSAIADISGLEAEDSRSVSLSGVFSDADGDAVTVTNVASSDSAVAAVSVSIDGATSAITGLTVLANSEGTATITVTARDADGNTVQDAFDVTVNAQPQQLQKKNSVPVVANAISDATIVNESGSHQVSLSSVFSDADSDALTVKATSSSATVATVAVANDNASLTVSAKARGTATITVTASDGYGGSVSDTFTVKVKAAPVVATAIPDATMVEVSSQEVDLSKVFSDADGDTLAYTVSSTDLDAVAVFEFHSAMTVFAIEKGKETVTVTAQDSDGNQVSDSFTVTVTAPANNPPTVASAIDDATIVNETGAHGVSLSSVFSDADGDALTITAASSADGVATVSVAADQSALTVAAQARGTATITVTAADGNGGTISDSFTVTVKAAPVVAAAIDDVSELEVDATHEVDLTEVFNDSDGDSLTVTAASSDDAKASVSVAADGSKLTLSGVAEGTATVTVTAEDADGNRVSDAFDVTVTENTASQFYDGEAAPGPVTDLQLTAEGVSLIVSWEAPAPDSGDEVRGYIVHLRPEGGGKGRTKTPKAKKTKVRFDNLEAGRTYKVWVRAQNAAGKGERVHASITLPEE